VSSNFTKNVALKHILLSALELGDKERQTLTVAVKHSLGTALFRLFYSRSVTTTIYILWRPRTTLPLYKTFDNRWRWIRALLQQWCLTLKKTIWLNY